MLKIVGQPAALDDVKGSCHLGRMLLEVGFLPEAEGGVAEAGQRLFLE